MNSMQRLLAVAAACGLAGTALGQYALDHNLQVGSGGRNPQGRDFKQELAFRNAIVTGNAPGGLSFRESVGYKAPGEFFGSLGSNDTFAFRRDSVYSGLAGMGIRGTDALQYQFAVTTGNAPPPGLTGIPVYGRAGTSALASDLSTSGTAARTSGLTDLSRPRPGDQGYDTRGLSLMAVRSPSAYMANRGLQPSLLGQSVEGTETRAVTASPLRGVAYDDLGILTTRKSKDDKKLPDSPLMAPSTAISSAAPSSGVNATEAGARTAYDDLMDRVKKNSLEGVAAAKPEPGTKPETKPEPGTTPGQNPLDKSQDRSQDAIPEWQRRINELRDELSDKRRPLTTPMTPGAKPGDNPDFVPGNKGDGTKGDGTKGDGAKNDGGKGDGAKSDQKSQKQGDDNGDQKSGESKRVRTISPETIELLRSAGGKINLLAPESFDAYGEQMKAGQERLAAARYFDAEERFTAALSVKPGDPMAAVGRVHAQLGAGMFLSASINLRSLMVEHPELAAVKYGTELLPGKDRTTRLMDRLHELVGQERGRDTALLLAYMGYQTGDAAAQKRGLEVMAAGGGEGENADQLARLAALLSRVWKAAAEKK